jgi:arsenate reductase
MSTDTDSIHIAFICVQNAGRSQMSAAFAERERQQRGLNGRVEIHTGGTDPADAVHEEVLAVMDEAGFDLSERRPREITIEELNSCDYVATMGCSTLEVGDVEDHVDVRDWALTDPERKTLDEVRGIRDEIERKVATLFDEIETAD